MARAALSLMSIRRELKSFSNSLVTAMLTSTDNRTTTDSRSPLSSVRPLGRLPSARAPTEEKCAEPITFRKNRMNGKMQH